MVGENLRIKLGTYDGSVTAVHDVKYTELLEEGCDARGQISILAQREESVHLCAGEIDILPRMQFLSIPLSRRVYPLGGDRPLCPAIGIGGEGIGG